MKIINLKKDVWLRFCLRFFFSRNLFNTINMNWFQEWSKNSIIELVANVKAT